MYSYRTVHRAKELEILRIILVENSAGVRVCCSGAGSRNGVVVFALIAELPAHISNVANFKEPVCRKLVLGLKVPLLNIWSSKARVKEVEIQRSKPREIHRVTGTRSIVWKWLGDWNKARAKPRICKVRGDA